jgi:hypothetical protein
MISSDIGFCFGASTSISMFRILPLTFRTALVLCSTLACESDSARQPATSDSFRPVAVSRVDSAVTPAPSCPATGQWSKCAILQRLERAGLAPQVDSAAIATESPLRAKGFLVRLSRSEAEVYLYESSSARKNDEDRLERSRYLDYSESVSMQTLPTLISSSNVLVVLHSRNDHQRERVGDAITAGLPSKQP